MIGRKAPSAQPLREILVLRTGPQDRRPTGWASGTGDLATQYAPRRENSAGIVFMMM
jgi:hypothetical protein